MALSAFINALYETNCVAIARRVYQARSAPRIGCLLPHIKAGYEVCVCQCVCVYMSLSVYVCVCVYMSLSRVGQ